MSNGAIKGRHIFCREDVKVVISAISEDGNNAILFSFVRDLLFDQHCRCLRIRFDTYNVAIKRYPPHPPT